MRRLKVTAEGMRYAFEWLADEPDPARRGLRATVMIYALKGPEHFGCTTFADVMKAQRVPAGMRSTMFRWIDLLDAYGLAWGRSDFRDESDARRAMGLPHTDPPIEDDEIKEADGTFAE